MGQSTWEAYQAVESLTTSCRSYLKPQSTLLTSSMRISLFFIAAGLAQASAQVQQIMQAISTAQEYGPQAIQYAQEYGPQAISYAQNYGPQAIQYAQEYSPQAIQAWQQYGNQLPEAITFAQGML